jgi:hypothetical protein
MRKLWNDPGRGQVPMGWTVSPAMLDAMPGALDYYYTSGTANDALVSGPSGWGYTYPNSFADAGMLDQFVSHSEDYLRRAGLRVVTVWSTVTGGINGNVGSSFAARATSLLGLTAQNTGGGSTVHDGKLPGFAFSCNYCTNEQAIGTIANGKWQYLGGGNQEWQAVREPGGTYHSHRAPSGQVPGRAGRDECRRAATAVDLQQLRRAVVRGESVARTPHDGHSEQFHGARRLRSSPVNDVRPGRTP